jgi:hypothetical protein
MALTAPNEGLCDQLDYLLSAPIVGVVPWYLVLWTNDDLTISQATVYADLTLATFTGYGPATLVRSGWTAAVLDGDQAVSTYGSAPVMWVNSGEPQTIYGWAIVTPVAPVIRYIEPLPYPVTLETGDPLGVLPRIALATLPVVMSLASRPRGIRRAAKPKGR